MKGLTDRNPDKGYGETNRTLISKGLGQHFLINDGVLNKIVSAAKITENEVVVEVGPGTGLLTKKLAKTGARVIALELDKNLQDRLKMELSHLSNVSVLAADGRTWDTDSIGRPYKMVANLPYYAATYIIRHFLESTSPPTDMIVTVQREVAQSMTASPGKMRMVSVATQLYGKPSILGYIKPGSFWPKPKVMSAIVKIQLHNRPTIDMIDADAFFRVVRGGFSNPRKQLHNSLKNSFEISESIIFYLLEKSGIDHRRRAESLTVAEWGNLHKAFVDDGIC